LSTEKTYILGADEEELFRLGVQHQVWADEAQHAWRLANFKSGQTLLDLGSGPGYCSKELAFIVGLEGKVIAVDKSASYINFLDKVAENYKLNIETIHTNFDQLELTASIKKF